MQTRRRRKQEAAPSLLNLPDSYLHHLVFYLSASSKLALRATCKAFLHAVDGASTPSSEETVGRSEGSKPCSQYSELQEAPIGLRLHLATRKPSFSALHAVHMLYNVVVLDTQAALRGAISIGCTNPTQQLASSMPALQLAVITNSQASLLDLLVHAAPQLSSIQLSITSSAPKVVTQLSQFSNIASLELTLAHPAWMKGCVDLGQLTQLQRLVIVGKPLDEANKHGIGAVSSVFWENNIAQLTGLTTLRANPWIKAVPEAAAGSTVTYSTLRNLRQLHVPYCTGKTGPGATASLLSQLASCSHLTSLCFGVHEFNWDVSNLSHLTQLKELEIHNPFLKEVWGLQPFTAAALAPLTAATGLTSLTLSHLRLPTLTDTMATAGQAVAAVAAQPGAAAALADALASGDGPAADIVHAIAAAAVATVLRGAAVVAGVTSSSDVESLRAVWCAVADTLQQQAAAAVAAASRQLPAAYGAQAAAAAAAAAGSRVPVGLPQPMLLPGAAVAAPSADGNAHVTLAPAVASGATGAAVPPEMLALAHEVIAAMAKHTALRLHQQQELQQQQQQQQQQQHPHQQLQQQQRPASSVCEMSKQQYLLAAHALAASVGPVVAAAAAAGAALPGGQLPAYLAVPPPPAQALAAAHLAAHVAGGNPLLAAAALAGPPVGFVAVPAVPPPIVPPPPPLGQQQQQHQGLAAVPAVGIPAAVPAAGLAAVSAAAANAAAVAAAAAAKASASFLFEQVPVLASLQRLTVGTTHGRLLSGVHMAALAPGLTCLEDLSELPRVPSVASDALGGLAHLQLLTVNVDTLQLYARQASLTGLRGLQNISSSVDASSNANNGGSNGQIGSGDVANRQAGPAATATAQTGAVLDASGSKPNKKGAKQSVSTAANGSKKKISRGSRAAQQAAAAAADTEALAHDLTAAAFPTTASAATTAVTGTGITPVSTSVVPVEHTAGQTAAAACSSNKSAQPTMLHLGSSWRQLSNLRCLRLLMLGHLQSPDAFSEVRILPTIPGVTRLELCSAFGGSLDYAETYTIEEDPYLWQEQVSVRELIVDGGVLLGGFMVNADMATLLKQKLRRLRRLVLCRCLDLTVEHLETAMQRGLAPVIAVKCDCRQVSECDVVRMNERLGAVTGVVVEYESVGAADYEGKSFTYAIDE